MTQTAFKHVLLMGRDQVPGVPETLRALEDFLLSLNVTVTNHGSPDGNIKPFPSSVDLIIVVGGDGSLINAAHIAVEHDLPVIGIHRGRLGFLTDIHPQHIDHLKDVINGIYREEKRFLLHATIHQHDVITDIALNDVVLTPNEAPQMVEFETYINDEFVCRQRADGLIIATPTGSTAYALSAGGPILKPGLNAVTIVSMCPHTLSSRPIVVSNDSCIKLVITHNNKNAVNISCDGITRLPVAPGSHIIIERYSKQLRLIHPVNYNYFTTLREKLNWEKHAERT